MTTVKVKDYRGANILILNNDWQTFISVVFHKGQFYAWQTDGIKNGEYTNKEFLLAVDNAYIHAKAIVDEVIQRSFPYKQINQIKIACQKFLRVSKATSPITK